eukprot:CAMPEP_0179366912 /NCGR_PEP_ID=MMETSP0797-20121207/83303_1 /TAXON_ID=47934 /ORGANISM="Dinophysis acuminata, Strain DAEP01" /LENGTH=238 /DNA_ID=CAMNT_0021082445 /DNA_START=267 /DNA_END=981 /DNA_ORIENTATION=+
MLDIGRQARGGGQCGFVEAGPDLDARGRAVGQYEGKGHDRTANTAAKVEETLPWTHVQVGDERGEGRETHLAGDEAPRGHRVAPQLLRRGMREVRDASEDLAVAAVHTHGHVLRSATRALQAATTGPVPARNDVVEVEPGHWRPHINVWRGGSTGAPTAAAADTTAFPDAAARPALCAGCQAARLWRRSGHSSEPRPSPRRCPPRLCACASRAAQAARLLLDPGASSKHAPTTPIARG